MAYQGISTGTTPNDGLGDSLATGAVKINSNFTEIYNALGDGTNLSVTTTTNINKTLGVNEFCAVVGEGVQLQLPTTQQNGSKVQICVAGQFTNTQVLRPPSLGAGVKIMGLEENFTIDSPNVTVTLVGIQTISGNPNSFDWRLV